MLHHHLHSRLKFQSDRALHRPHTNKRNQYGKKTTCKVNLQSTIQCSFQYHKHHLHRMGFNLDEHGKPAFLGRNLQTMQNTSTHPHIYSGTPSKRQRRGNLLPHIDAKLVTYVFTNAGTGWLSEGYCDAVTVVRWCSRRAWGKWDGGWFGFASAIVWVGLEMNVASLYEVRQLHLSEWQDLR